METTILRDIYNRPITRGHYHLVEPNREPITVFIHANMDGLWVVEDTSQHIGSTKRFKALQMFHPYSQLTRLSIDGEAMEPGCHGYDHTSKLDELGKIEQLILACRAEMRRCELLACQVMGVEIADGSQSAEAAFDMCWNGKSAEATLKEHIEDFKRRESQL
ncbi:hypothetical protein SH449x_000781 [Pirellulaceae bacterium SH449]